jgi:hypothetical protein
VQHSTLPQLFQEDLYHFTTPVIVVLSKPWDDYPPAEQVLLQKILTSVKIDINAIQIVSRPSITLKSLLPFSPDRVLIFGSETEQEIALYQQTPAQGFIVIRADDLSQLNDDKKKNLWIVLRQMFGI